MLATDRPALPPVEGAILRIQLDGIIDALPCKQPHDDPAAVRLLNHLIKARNAAAEIEERAHTSVPYRGVHL